MPWFRLNRGSRSPAEIMTAYDEVLYPSYTHSQTHPDVLATLATLFGMTPRPVDRCRVLELGCGNGSNLVPMAAGLPGSEFVGIDLAARPVAAGQADIAALGLKNIRLEAGDLGGIDAAWGRFDYIIAHGLYSWVPPQVRDRLMAVCRNRLADQGVAFVSYHAYPGAHINMMLREMLLFHTRDVEAPAERINQAFALMQFLAGASESMDAYHQWLRAEAGHALKRDRNHLFHDDLAEINDPVYFHEFVGHAARHDLQFLAEADFFTSSDNTFSAPTRKTLDQLAAKRLVRGQYLDFLTCRRFRLTLLCRREVDLPPEPLAERLAGFQVSAHRQNNWAAADLRPGAVVTFTARDDARIQTDFPLGKAALSLLAAAWPFSVQIESLVERARQHLLAADIIPPDAAEARTALFGFILELYRAGFLLLRTLAPGCVTTVSERPQAAPLVRWQAAHGRSVTSAFHSAVQIQDELGIHLLALLDGTRDFATLAGEMHRFLEEKGALKNETASGPELRLKVEREVRANLEKLVRIGLLVG